MGFFFILYMMAKLFTLVLFCMMLVVGFGNSDHVLSPSFQMFNADVDAKGEVVFKRWVPLEESNNSRQKALETMFKRKHHIKLDMADLLSGKHPSANQNDNKSFEGRPRPKQSNYEFQTKKASLRQQTEQVNAIVEVLLVCDKEFADIFNHDNKRIMDYLTVYMWDVNSRFQSLPSVNISFVVNGIVAISSFEAQPFIEDTRGTDGKAEMNKILDRYPYWVFSQMQKLPKFDMAPLITNAQLEWYGGLTIRGGTCDVNSNEKKNSGTLVFSDDGRFESVVFGAHEMAHSLGAPHDDWAEFPGGCTEKGFIMSGANETLKYFFSSCTDRVISDFVRSEQGACLRKIDGQTNPVIDPWFSNPKAPTMDEHCKLSLKNHTAYIETEHTFNCKNMRCLVPINEGTVRIFNLSPVENTICGGNGRCFRGRCRPLGYNFKNKGSGLCIRSSNQFDFETPAEMMFCPRDDSPLKRLAITNTTNGINLATPFTFNGNHENGEKCLWTGNNEGDEIWTDRCDKDNAWQGWDFKDIGNGEFLLVHRVTKRCAKPNGNAVRTYGDCNSKDAYFRWTRYV